MPHQLYLDLALKTKPNFDNYIPGKNTQVLMHFLLVLDRLGKVKQAQDYHFHQRMLYLWGETGGGRTHLLQALIEAAEKKQAQDSQAFPIPSTSSALPAHSARYITPSSPLVDFLFDDDIKLYCVDDCESLNEEQQIALFNLFNEIQAAPQTALVVTGNTTPLALPIREDLRTRLSWGSLFQIHALSDQEKLQALTNAVEARRIKLSADVLPYLLVHYERNMHNLMDLLNALDQFALQEKRAITLPLLKQMLANT